jgi:hypothetical protein
MVCGCALAIELRISYPQRYANTNIYDQYLPGGLWWIDKLPEVTPGSGSRGYAQYDLYHWGEMAGDAHPNIRTLDDKYNGHE